MGVESLLCIVPVCAGYNQLFYLQLRPIINSHCRRLRVKKPMCLQTSAGYCGIILFLSIKKKGKGLVAGCCVISIHVHLPVAQRGECIFI
jgi:hypothetical protein